MRRGTRPVALIVALATLAGCTGDDRPDGELLAWSELPALPDPIGFAGPFAGVARTDRGDDVLVVAGGANFPDGRPWNGAPKVWHDRVFVLDDPAGEWRIAETRLPRPTAYGVSLSWEGKVVCVGGGDAERHFADAYLLGWDGSDVEIESLPELPGSAAFTCGALHGDTVYVMGGLAEPGSTEALRSLWALDLAAGAEERAWLELEPAPGPGRHLSIAAAQAGSVLLIGGIRLRAADDGSPERIRPYLDEAWRYDPARAEWSRMADVPRPVAAAPSPGFALGPAHVLVLGGDDGSLAGDLRDAHPGFEPEILAYHTITDTWIEAGELPKDLGPDPAGDPNAGVWPTVTTAVVEWRDRIVVPTGEARPGVRTPRVPWAEPVSPEPGFAAVDYAVLVLYLASLVAMGVYFSRREKTTEDFFLGGRRVPAWAAGISIFGTQLSAITFMAVPAKTYATNWVYFPMNMGILAIAPVVVYLYLPFFRRLDVTTAYEYLERRFHLSVRLLGSVSFIVFQVARMGIVLCLPALALSAVTGMDVRACIVLMGVLCTIYTVLGGIEAVIWTDVIQVFVLMGGALLAFGTVLASVDGGFGGFLDVARSADKLQLVDGEADWTGPALVVILLGAFFNNLVPYTTDQAVVQRYLTTPDERRSARAVWTGAWLAVPASVLFFGMGTALYVYYRENPELLNPLGKGDQIFAWFIVRELPVGVAGLVIAGVFAAAMSSLDSSMNSIATTITVDFRRRFRSDLDDAYCLRFARRVTVVLGVVGTAAGLWIASLGDSSLWDQFLGFVGLLGGTLAGLFALGILSRRASTASALVGAAASVVALAVVKLGTDISGLAYAAIGTTVCAGVGWVASLALPHRKSELTGLTIHTLGEKGRRDGDGID